MLKGIKTRIELRNEFREIILRNETRMQRATLSMRASRKDSITISELAALRAYKDALKGLSFEKSFSSFLFENRQELPIGNTPLLEMTDLGIDETLLIDSSNLVDYIPIKENDFRKCNNWFNGSIIEYNGMILFAYRMDSRPYCTQTKIAICRLYFEEGKYYAIKGGSQVLKLKTNRIAEDPRLFIFNNELYISYCDGYSMLQAKINPETFEASDCIYLDKPQENRTEKNWVFFESENKLFALYSITPNIVYEVNGKNIEQVTETSFYPFHWIWGEPHGGTTPILHDGLYYTFFHSSTNLYYEDPSRNGRQYFIGCFVFASKKPFAPKLISKEPLFAATFVDHPERLSNDIFVVFPAGQLRVDDGFMVSMGYNDFENRIIKFSDELLKENLIKA